MDGDWKNIEWIFSGIGVSALGGIIYLFKDKFRNSNTKLTPIQSITINQNNNNGTHGDAVNRATNESTHRSKIKSAVSILFIDDDTKFKVVTILKNNGWTNAKIIKDITSLEQPEVASADIFFVDIQGVGKALQFKDEGLGLVVALKKRYPEKRVVIYSAENGLNAFHAAFKMADDRISKDADPYEFISIVEQLSEQ
jgi:ActR/RegA family two-component response regulator